MTTSVENSQAEISNKSALEPEALLRSFWHRDPKAVIQEGGNPFLVILQSESITRLEEQLNKLKTLHETGKVESLEEHITQLKDIQQIYKFDEQITDELIKQI